MIFFNQGRLNPFKCFEMIGNYKGKMLDEVSRLEDDLKPLEDDVQTKEDDLQTKDDDLQTKEDDLDITEIGQKDLFQCHVNKTIS